MPEKWPRDLWLDAIWEDEALKPNHRVVAYVYARFAGKHDVAWCSYDEIMRRTGMRDRSSVSTALRGLVGAGWLCVVERAKQRRSAVYRLTCPLQQSGFPTSKEPASSRESLPLAANSPGSAVGITGVSSRDSRIQQSGLPPPREQIDNSEEIPDRARDLASSPSGLQAALKCDPRCKGGLVRLGVGQIERCPVCRPEGAVA